LKSVLLICSAAVSIPAGRDPLLTPSVPRACNPGRALRYIGRRPDAHRMRSHQGFPLAVLGFLARLRPRLSLNNRPSLTPEAQAAAQVTVGRIQPQVRRSERPALKIFISHASEDKTTLVLPLVQALKTDDLDVWYDEYELTIGDSLAQKIDQGIAECDYGIVILSEAFFAKSWPRVELDALISREIGARSKVVLPIWHGVDAAYVQRFSPILAAKLAANSKAGTTALVSQIRRAVGLSFDPAANETKKVRSLMELQDDLMRHLDSLRYTLTDRFPEEIRTGHLDVTRWQELRDVDEWIGTYRYHFPKAVREALAELLQNYQKRLNEHLDFLRSVLQSGAPRGANSPTAYEHQRRLQALIDNFDKEATALRNVRWLEAIQ
jgi:hypothetical protein